MRKRSTGKTELQRWQGANDWFKESFPQVFSKFDVNEDFIELRMKARDDGTCLAIMKVFGSDGGPMVCFGSGYGVIGCLLGLEGAIASNKWRVDKPWRPSPSGNSK